VDEFLREVDPNWDWAKMDVDDGHELTAPVGSFASNNFGLFDMAGNVDEWCNDRYHQNYYNLSLVKNPQGTITGPDRVLRGRSFLSTSHHLTVFFRYALDPYKDNDCYGFRCVADIE
tara:strand:- start:40 stop:390 length:351 start_codon:yes stop_codon:yes gene_type:complete